MITENLFDPELAISQLASMLKIQNDVNCIIDEQWVDRGRDWFLYIACETNELIDRLGFKHWAKHPEDSEINIQQNQIELVDAAHFMFSQMCIERKKMTQDSLENDYLRKWLSAPAPHLSSKEVRLMYARQLMQAALNNDLDKTMASFAQLCAHYDLGHNELYGMYIGKAALNGHRANNGYKDGSYVKMWDGREDNEHLYEIIDANIALTQTLSPDELKQFYEQKLADKYSEVTSSRAQLSI